MNRLANFRVFYNQSIQPELVRLDRKRRRLLRLIFFSALVLVGVIIFEIMLNILVVTLVMMIPIVIYIGYLSYQVRKFKLEFKPKVVELILDFIDDDPNFGTLEYKPKEKIPLKVFNRSGIFGVPKPAVYNGEDLIKGRYGEIEFEMSELNVREFSKVRSRINYVFRGVFLHAKIRHELDGELLILPSDFRQYLSRSIKQFTSKGGRNINRSIKNRAFREEFMVFSGRRTILKSILSDYMMRSIMEYIDREDKYIYISFRKSDIYLAVTEQKDLLEPFLFQSNVSFDLIREFFEDIHMLLEIVEDLDSMH